MNRLWVVLVAVGCSLPLLGLAPNARAGGAGTQADVKVGAPAPDFFLRDLEGIMHRLSDLAFPGKETSWKKKRKVLIDFFRTDCKPCMQELPQVVAFYEKHKDEVQVLMVALLEEENGRAKLDQWLKQKKLPFPVLVDAYETVAKKYIVRGDTVSLPSMFLIDENGVVRSKLDGLKEDLEASLKDGLASGPTAKAQ